MIRVNLLPQEYRKAEATPLKQFFATIGATVLAAAVVAYWAYVHFAKLADTQQRLTVVTAEVDGQAKELKYVRDLDAELKEYKSRVNTLNDKARSRLVWSRKLDELWEILVNPRVPGKYEVWIKSLSCALTVGAGPFGGTTRFGGTSAGEAFLRLSEFHEDIERSDFFRDYKVMTQPGGSVNRGLQGDRVPKEGWDFDFTLGLKPLKDLYADREAAVKAAEQTGGGGPK